MRLKPDKMLRDRLFTPESYSHSDILEKPVDWAKGRDATDPVSVEHFMLPNIAISAGCNQVFRTIISPFHFGKNMVDLQHNFLAGSPTILSPETIPCQDGEAQASFVIFHGVVLDLTILGTVLLLMLRPFIRFAAQQTVTLNGWMRFVISLVSMLVQTSPSAIFCPQPTNKSCPANDTKSLSVP